MIDARCMRMHGKEIQGRLKSGWLEEVKRVY
jgi:hypothetical protein